MRTNLDKEFDKRMGLIKSICPDASIEFRTHPIVGATRWYVSTPGLELAQDGMLGSIDSNGASPDEAVNALYVNLTNTQHVFKKDNKRYLRWTGYMFDEALPRKCDCGKPAEPHVPLCSACLFAEHLEREKREDFAR